MSDNVFSTAWDNITKGVENGITQAEEGAQQGISNWVSDMAKKLFNTPTVQAQAKKATGNAIGGWIVDNWQLIAGVTAGLIILAIATRKKW